MRKVLILMAIALLTSCHSRNNFDESSEPTDVQQQMIEEGWILGNPDDGDLPEEYGITPRKGIVDNFFDVVLNGDADMVIKIINIETGEIVRYMFVPHNSRTTINEIPAGKYYLKLAYGNDWMCRSDGNHTDGKFTRNVFYEKSNNYIDFGNVGSLESMSKKLEITINGDNQHRNFPTSTITEEEFNE